MPQPLLPEEPDWLDEFRDLANRELGDPTDGASCEQVHPIVEQWYRRTLEQEPPASRDAVMQAMACLSTEILGSAPEELVGPILEHVNEDDLATWVEFVLMMGRAFEASLRDGDLDDL